MFDDSNLFRVDKFSGWDRVEGGGRANYGVQYTAQFNQGGFVNALFGQSYQLFGQNSFAQGGTTNTGLDSGLDTTPLRLCGALLLSAEQHLYLHLALPLRQRHISPCGGSSSRPAPSSTAGTSRCSTATMPRSPNSASSTAARASSAPASVKLDANWVLLGAARYDINAGKFDQTRLGLGYIDDCLILAVNYITSYTYSGNVDHRPHDHAAVEPAHARRHLGQPGRRRAAAASDAKPR